MPRPKGYSPLFGRVLSPRERKAFKAGKLLPPDGMRRSNRVLKVGSMAVSDLRQFNKMVGKLEKRLDPMIEKGIERALEKLIARVRFDSAMGMTLTKRRGRRPKSARV